MKTMKVFLLAVLSAILAVSFAYAAEKPKPKAENASVEKGKALFNNPKLGGGTVGKSCNSCHYNGQGLEKSGAKEEFNIMGKKQKGLEEAINFCIEIALKGKAIDPKSDDMKSMVIYIKSLGKKAPEKR
ncbi:MAG: hypothetical protein HZC12_05895 [Nitrospirae bacterium]|nr:hypothetical protein [Nitrospirota bacterium]